MRAGRGNEEMLNRICFSIMYRDSLDKHVRKKPIGFTSRCGSVGIGYVVCWLGVVRCGTACFRTWELD